MSNSAAPELRLTLVVQQMLTTLDAKRQIPTRLKLELSSKHSHQEKRRMAITIAQASVFIEEFLEVLENVYWESNSINIKNQCFNAVRLLQGELTELTKVSIQDHHYEYEIISCSSSVMQESVMQLNALLENEALRIRTSGQLTPLMEQAGQIYN